MRTLRQQRIRYMIEFGGIYPHDEPASKNFVLKWLAIFTLLHFVVDYVVAILS